jgi:hypothetical protein
MEKMKQYKSKLAGKVVRANEDLKKVKFRYKTN